MYVSICHVSICSPNSLCAYLYWEREKMHIRMFLQHQIIPFVQCTYDTPILLFWSYRVQCFYTSELIPCNKCLGMWHTPNTHSLALIQYLYILWMSPIPANFDWAITMAREGATTENDIEMEKICSGWLAACLVEKRSPIVSVRSLHPHGMPENSLTSFTIPYWHTYTQFPTSFHREFERNFLIGFNSFIVNKLKSCNKAM